MYVSVQLHASANLLPGEKAPVPTEKEAGRAPDLVDTLKRKKNIFPLPTIETCLSIWSTSHIQEKFEKSDKLWGMKKHSSYIYCRTRLQLRKKNVNRAQCDNYVPENNAQNQNRKHTNVMFTWGNNKSQNLQKILSPRDSLRSGGKGLKEFQRLTVGRAGRAVHDP
jgi:TFIIF-interacting CTD phosphatase-like protein